jgi:hypothetical protein
MKACDSLMMQEFEAQISPYSDAELLPLRVRG